LKSWIFGIGLALQVPLLVLWAMGAGSNQGSRGPGSMAMVVPAIICAVLWFAGGFAHATLLVLEGVRAKKAGAGFTAWLKTLVATLLAWAAVTAYLSLR
jgi:hypothetical protein